MSFPFFQQLYGMDCGPTCLRMIATYHGIPFHQEQMKDISRIKKEGSSMLDLVEAAEEIGIEAKGLEITLNELKSVPLPAILHWNNFHFVVLFKISKNSFWIADPAIGITGLNRAEFLTSWHYIYRGKLKTGTILTFQVRQQQELQ